jgi:hypothetical protein
MKEGCLPRRRILRIALEALAIALVGQAALAQAPKPGAAAPAKTHATTHPAPKRLPAAADAGASSSGAAPMLTTVPSAPPGAGLPGDAGVVEAKTLDGGMRVFKFRELEIEGRLKSPQLVYFLRRVRAEFAAGDLGHRSFLREMSETRKESTF